MDSSEDSGWAGQIEKTEQDGQTRLELNEFGNSIVRSDPVHDVMFDGPSPLVPAR